MEQYMSREEVDRKYMAAMEAIKLAYRYHHLQDDDIDSNELSAALAIALQEHMDDDGFQRWIKEVSPWDDDEDNGDA
jgi:hypothetical protein